MYVYSIYATEGCLVMSEQLSTHSSEMNQLTLQSNAQAQLDVLKKDKSTKEECIRRM